MISLCLTGINYIFDPLILWISHEDCKFRAFTLTFHTLAITYFLNFPTNNNFLSFFSHSFHTHEITKCILFPTQCTYMILFNTSVHSACNNTYFQEQYHIKFQKQPMSYSQMQDINYLHLNIRTFVHYYKCL